MKTKIDLKKLVSGKWIGFAVAAAAAIGAFTTEIDNQKKEKLIEDLADRVTKLENK